MLGRIRKSVRVILSEAGILFLSVSSLIAQGSAPVEKDVRMRWWRDAKYGMFVHWGLYSIPGGVWNGNEVKGIGEWIMAHADIPETLRK